MIQLPAARSYLILLFFGFTLPCTAQNASSFQAETDTAYTASVKQIPLLGNQCIWHRRHEYPGEVVLSCNVELALLRQKKDSLLENALGIARQLFRVRSATPIKTVKVLYFDPRISAGRRLALQFDKKAPDIATRYILEDPDLPDSGRVDVNDTLFFNKGLTQFVSQYPLYPNQTLLQKFLDGGKAVKISIMQSFDPADFDDPKFDWQTYGGPICKQILQQMIGISPACNTVGFLMLDKYGLHKTREVDYQQSLSGRRVTTIIQIQTPE